MPVWRTKMFEEHRVLQRTGPGGTWSTLQQSAPLDDSINAWLQDTGNVIAAVSPPGMHSYWLDVPMTTRAVMVAVVVTYQERQSAGRTAPDDPAAATAGETAAAPPAEPPGDF